MQPVLSTESIQRIQRKVNLEFLCHWFSWLQWVDKFLPFAYSVSMIITKILPRDHHTLFHRIWNKWLEEPDFHYIYKSHVSQCLFCILLSHIFLMRDKEPFSCIWHGLMAHNNTVLMLEGFWEAGHTTTPEWHVQTPEYREIYLHISINYSIYFSIQIYKIKIYFFYNIIPNYLYTNLNIIHLFSYGSKPTNRDRPRNINGIDSLTDQPTKNRDSRF